MVRREQEGSPYKTPALYGDGDTPEIGLPRTVDATSDILDKFPGREQSGWMRSM